VHNTEWDSMVGGMQHLLNALVRLPGVTLLDGSRRRGNELWIEIYDTGIDIPVDRIDTIFGELHQLDPQREDWGWDCGLRAAPRRYSGTSYRCGPPLAGARGSGSSCRLGRRANPKISRSTYARPGEYLL
jgi:hypothetical protein